MTRRFIRLVFGILLLCGLLPSVAQAERRLGFVVGIDQYGNLGGDAQLQRAVSDATAVAATLRQIGFTVTEMTGGPITQTDFLRRFGEFTRTIEAGDLVLFYFSGHGLGLDGVNYLLPSDIPALQVGDERLVKARALSEADIADDLKSKGARVVILVLDACRNNPFADPGHRSLGLARGFERVEPAEGVLTIYAASGGKQALDRLSDTGDPDPNSVFTRVFLKEMKRPGQNVSELGDRVRDEVAALARSAGQDQVPAVSNEIIGARGIVLASGGASSAEVPLAQPTPAAASPAQPGQCAALFGAARSIDTRAAYQAYLDQCPRDGFAGMAQAAQARLATLDTPPAPAGVAAAQAGGRDLPPVAPTASAPAEPTPTAGFDCGYAHSRVEHLICDEPALAADDRTLVDLFGQVLATRSGADATRFRFAELAWVQERDRCEGQADRAAMRGCVQRAYDARLGELRASLTASAPAGRPSPAFNCANARSAVEKAICNDDRLASRDRQLQAAFTASMQRLTPAQQKGLVKDEATWWFLREACGRQNPGALNPCILAAYDRRLRELGAE